MAEPASAPYASPANVLTVITRYRERGLPDPLTRRQIESLGVASSVTSHVFSALRFLNLIDEEGRRTEAFERLRRATTEEYPEVLAEIIRSAYHEVLTIVDPMQDSITAINDAFRHFEPAAQRDRMVTLFLGLSREAGLAPEGRQRRPTPTRQQGRARVTPPRRQPTPPPQQGQASPPRTSNVGESGEADGMPDYRLLNVLLGQLPREGHWTKERRERWIQAITAAVDLVVEVDVKEV